ncbi:MAG: 1-phosphofructokinase [Clostridia bacterium]|nr:1-phosphofructokinase [Clostridia bacterium]
MIITITLNPAVDKTVEIIDFEVGTVNRVSTTRLDAGGKGINVSKVVRSLGGNSRATGILGGTTGSFIKEAMDRLGIENDFLFIEGETRTNLKVVDSKRKTNTDINEPGPSIASSDIEALKQKIFSRLEAGSVVVFSGSVPANTDKDIYGKWISAAKEAGAKTILDADGELLKHGIEAGPYLVKPNIHELERFFGIRIEDVREAERLARSLIEVYGIELVAVSLGERGAIFVNKENSLFAHSIPVEVKSTVGAGDSMVAALAYSIDMGYSFEKAVRLAVASGTANVMTSGTQSAELEIIKGLENKVTFEYFRTYK